MGAGSQEKSYCGDCAPSFQQMTEKEGTSNLYPVKSPAFSVPQLSNNFQRKVNIMLDLKDMFSGM